MGSSASRQGHQLFREVQPTEWSRKQSLWPSRTVEDIRAWELSHRGLSELSFRLVSEGRYQGIVWTRSASEAVFTTQLLKRTRELDVDIDEVARTFLAGEIPDKHKDASKFMPKLPSDLVDHMKAKPSCQQRRLLMKLKPWQKPTPSSQLMA